MSKSISKLHFCFSLLYLIVALLGFVYLAIYEYDHAVFWSLVSATFSLANGHLHLLHIYDWLERWHSAATLSGIKCLSFVASVIILSVIAWYIFCLFYFESPVLSPNTGEEEMKLLQAIGWSFTSLVGTLSLYWAAVRYTKILTEVERQPLLPQ